MAKKKSKLQLCMSVLSRDDEQAGESNSIQTKRNISKNMPVRKG